MVTKVILGEKREKGSPSKENLSSHLYAKAGSVQTPQGLLSCKESFSSSPFWKRAPGHEQRGALSLGQQGPSVALLAGLGLRSLGSQMGGLLCASRAPEWHLLT